MAKTCEVLSPAPSRSSSGVAMEPVRIRVAFEDRHVLSKSQRREGLKRFWLLLRPELDTIAALASHIVRTFRLQDSCPSDLILSMDRFVLPPFESTDIFKDKDMLSVRVRKKDGAPAVSIKFIRDANRIEDSEIIDKQPLHLYDSITVAKEFEKESGGYQSEDEEDSGDQPTKTVCPETSLGGKTGLKRKKDSDRLLNSNITVGKEFEKESDGYQSEDEEDSGDQPTKTVCPETSLGGKTGLKRGKDSDKLLSSKITVAKEFEKESGGFQNEDEEDSGDQPTKTVRPETSLGGKTGLKRKKDSNKLLSSKRKKIKQSGADEYPTVSLEASGNVPLEDKENHSHKDGNKQESPSRELISTNKARTSKANASTEKSIDQITEDRYVEAQDGCQSNASKPNVNGGNKKRPSRNALRKKARRQWLRELKNSEKKEFSQSDILENGTHQKSEVHHSPDHDSDFEEEVVPVVVKPGHIRFEPLGQSEQPSHKPVETLKWNGTVSKKKGQKWGRERSSSCRMNDAGVLPAQLRVESVEEDDEGDQLAEFEKLFPLTRLPKVGDVLAYRVVELSSLWCPELSSFRVGKVTSYDPTSMKIILVQVPDYPISFGARDGGGSGPDSSLYKEDGSLEIDFQSLHDVRLFDEDKVTVNLGTSERKQMGTRSSTRVQKPGSASSPANVVIFQATDNEQGGGWEEISQALDARKAELSHKEGWDSWDRKGTTATSSWSYRALRWGALGPTISLLRANNDI